MANCVARTLRDLVCFLCVFGRPPIRSQKGLPKPENRTNITTLRIFRVIFNLLGYFHFARLFLDQRPDISLEPLEAWYRVPLLVPLPSSSAQVFFDS